MRKGLQIRLLLALLIVLPQPLLPATITVDGSGSAVADDGECSLREAITAANTDTSSGGTAGECPAGVGADTIELTTDVTLDTVDSGGYGLPLVTTTIEIQGNDFTVRRDSEAPDFGIFSVDGSSGAGDLTLQSTTVSGASLGVNSFYGTATITNSTISGNSGRGIYAFSGSLNLTTSTISGNSGRGISIVNSAQVKVANSTISGNSGGGIGTITAGGSTLTITDSALSGNGNSAASGGGIYVDFATVTLTNSTLSSNSADSGGGIFNAYGTVGITNSTLSGNSAAGSGVAIYNYAGTVSVANSLLANSAGGGNCDGTITDNGSNLASDGTCGPGFGALAGLDPRLLDNGGPTKTHALLDGSNAIDNAGACGTARDQRGAIREGNCDIGAFELQSCTEPTLVLDTDTVDGNVTRTNCRNIVVGPALTVAGTGDLTLRAGSSIALGNGTSVETGGVLTLALDGGLQIGNIVFVTSESYSGDLDGPAGADAKCNERAAAAGLSGSFKAWLSSTNPNRQPAQTFTQSNAPYVRVDGVRIADDWSDLTDGSLLAAIELDEFGNPASFNNSWTATLTDGTSNPAVRDCLSWESNSGTVTGWMGIAYQTGQTWTDWIGFESCDSPKTLYCFEQ